MLSKSQYMKGLQCHKALWLTKNRRELAAKPDQRRLNLFATGHQVGELAQQLFPGGIEVTYRAGDYAGMCEETTGLLRNHDVIYEGSFCSDGVFVRADILVKNGEAWDLYEVKATAGTKGVHKPDVAIQWYVISQHLPLGKAYLVHLNNGYQRQGEIDVQGLFELDDVTEDVQEQLPHIRFKLNELESMLEGEEPDTLIGTHCNSPYECDFHDYCWQGVPYPSVLDLYRMNGDKRFDYYHQGIVSYADVAARLDLKPAQALQVDTALSGETWIDREAIKEFLADVCFPINFLDFETYQDAVPRFDGQSPYKNIPFQYSLHILHDTGELEHKEFLADAVGDPRLTLTRQLLDDVTDQGTLFAYHQSFEIGVINALAGLFEQHAAELQAMVNRFKDLEVPFNRLMYYHPDFNGSFSIKSILPALFPDDPELDYKNLEVKSGDVAMSLFPRLAEMDDPEEIQSTREALLAYCHLDTLAMVKLYSKLKEASET